MYTELIKQLEETIGTKWENYGKSRLYLDWHTLIRLELSYYNTGNISEARLDGEKISNSRARDIKSGKAWIDLHTGELQFCNWIVGSMKELIEDELDNMLENK